MAAPETKALGDGAVCWRDQRRICDGTCVAFNVEAESGSFDRCVLLVFRSQEAAAAMRAAKAAEGAPRKATGPATAAPDLFPPPPQVKK
jgi:hypothetical protein